MIDATKYPLHAEMEQRKAEQMVVQQVVDWIAEHGYTLCTYERRPHNQDGDYIPLNLHEGRLVGAIMGIDHAAFMAEKDRMLADFIAESEAKRA